MKVTHSNPVDMEPAKKTRKRNYIRQLERDISKKKQNEMRLRRQLGS
jgi:hypothetical protein